ncbi:MAG TPA: hypothetical protein VNC12_05730 [Solirubrobacteraceae bacterium]|nr:hypothetical protein [Solirubrobacteraceae bacterium]
MDLVAHVTGSAKSRERCTVSERAIGDAVDLLACSGIGPVWGMASADLNATLLVWPAGEHIAEHRNVERDVLLVVIEGSMTVIVDEHPRELRATCALLVERGRRRSVAVGAGGVRYLSIHLRRGPLQIEPRPSSE